MTERTVRSTLLLAMLAALTSCGDQAPTDVMFDVAGTNEALSAVRNVVMSPDMDAHLSLAPRFTAPDGSPLIARHQAEANLRIPVLPAAYLGVTFALDGPDGSYAPTEIPGAPADALRYIIYSADASGDPLVESAIGHADLTDDGVEMENGFAVGIVVTIDDLVIADYTTSFDAQGGTGGLARATAFDHVGLMISGEFRTATDEIQIAMVTGTVNDIITTEFEIVSGTATISGQVMEELASELRLLQGEFQLGADRLGVSANGGAASFGAQITINGADWATVSVQPESITVTGDAGTLDSTEQSVALRLAEYFLTVPSLANGLVAGVLSQ